MDNPGRSENISQGSQSWPRPGLREVPSEEVTFELTARKQADQNPTRLGKYINQLLIWTQVKWYHEETVGQIKDRGQFTGINYLVYSKISDMKNIF